MKTDLELIKELEKEIGMELPQVWLDYIMRNDATGFALDYMGHVVGLSIDGVKLKIIPKILIEFKRLEVLLLMNTHLRDISSLKNLNELTMLDLTGNELTDISSLKELKKIRVLYMTGNKLSDISILNELKWLNTLGLSGNSLTDISSLKNLKSLTRLYLSDNQLKNINSLKELRYLTTLYLANNQINDITNLKDLKALTTLDLSYNKITKLPTEFLDLKMKVKWGYDRQGGIFLEGNPLEMPPVEIVKQGPEAVRVYFKSLEGKKRALKEVKVLLVGDGGAGKTSLAKQLMGETFDEEEAKTDGININHWNVPDSSGDTQTKVNLWDFGGQEIMHATHQFFLSRRSLYILVLDGRRDEKTEYWLNHIKSFGGDSPVMVVLNKIDQNPSFDVNRLFLKKKYPNIKDFFRISCATKHGLKEFAHQLTEELSAIEHIRTQWAASWFNVKKRLENMTKHYITVEEYENICAEEKITGEEARQTLLDFLNDLGIALHFKDLSLAGTHVLDPKWITNAVYKIINSDILSNCKGVLKLSLLEKILKPKDKEDYVYPKEKYSYIIDLMHKFELCFEMDKQRVLVPDLLDIGEPPIDFDSENSLKFQVFYEFLPKSVMPRFIVKRHKEIKGELRWRTGVVLENKDFAATAVVKVDERDKKIFIEINGTQKRDYLATIIHTLREIHSSFEKIIPDERVPLPDNPDITVSYLHLVRLETMKEPELVPEGAMKRYNVKALLDGIKPADVRQKEAEQLLRENKIILNISPTQITEMKTMQIQQTRQDVNVDVDVDVDIEVNLSIELPALQGEFDDLKELLLQANPGLKEKLTQLGDGLDALSPKSDPKQLNAPLNKLRRFLEKLGDEKSEYNKVLRGVKKGIDTFKKVGRTYNKVAQWLALPQVPDVFLK